MKLEDYLDEGTIEMAVIKATRDAGRIRRCHTMDTERYNVGEHTYNMTQMLLRLHTNPSVRLVRAIMMHDVPEVVLGDVPAPTKWEYPEIAAAFKEAEEKVFRRLYPDQIIPSDLDDDDKAWLKSLDWLELYLWSIDQYIQGDTRCLMIGERLRECSVNLNMPLRVISFIYEVEKNWRGVVPSELFKTELGVGHVS